MYVFSKHILVLNFDKNQLIKHSSHITFTKAVLMSNL